MFDMLCKFIILVSETPYKLPEFRGIAIQKASYSSEGHIRSPNLISINKFCLDPLPRPWRRSNIERLNLRNTIICGLYGTVTVKLQIWSPCDKELTLKTSLTWVDDYSDSSPGHKRQEEGKSLAQGG